MARLARVVAPGIPYHVTHRGNHRANIYFATEDRDVYTAYLTDYCARYGLDIWAYCFMTNHVHLIAVGSLPHSMARGIGLAHMRYSRWVNDQRGWTGHLWANRFHSTAMDNEHLWSAVRYVELNPVRAGLVERAEDYPWSSARFHSGVMENDPILSVSSPFPGSIENWPDWLHGTLEADSNWDNLRRNTSTGRPSGSIAFVRGLEKQLNRILERRKPGPRPSREADTLTEDLFA